MNWATGSRHTSLLYVQHVQVILRFNVTAIVKVANITNTLPVIQGNNYQNHNKYRYFDSMTIIVHLYN